MTHAIPQTKTTATLLHWEQLDDDVMKSECKLGDHPIKFLTIPDPAENCYRLLILEYGDTFDSGIPLTLAQCFAEADNYITQSTEYDQGLFSHG